MDKTTPKINYFRYKENCLKLNHSINSKDEKNIAIAGVYGSGKSSLINTYEKVYNNKNASKVLEDEKNISLITEFDEGKLSLDSKELESINNELEEIEQNPINESMVVSLANFNISNQSKKEVENSIEKESTKDSDNSRNKEDSKEPEIISEKDKIIKEINLLKNIGEHTKIESNENLIEKSLLQQFLFKESSRKLFDSRVNRVKPTLRYKIPTYVFFILSVLFFSVYWINKFNFLWGYNRVVEIIFISMFSLSIIPFVILLPLIFKIKTLSIDKIELSVDDNSSSESLINRYLDEIIYFFSKTKYKIVYFEDLDRLTNLEIFNKLRELNFILNNSKMIKRKITFVYCVSDSIITDYEERVKFFDRIITVVPYITFETVKKDIVKFIQGQNEWNEGFQTEILNEYADQISKFVIDARLIKHVENDYNEMVEKYKKNKTKDIELIEILKIFTLSIYKNYYYDDYNKLSTNEAVLSKTFKLINYLKNEEIIKLKDKIKTLESEMQKSQLDEYADIKIFKERMLGIYYQLKSYNGHQVYNPVNLKTCTLDEIITGKYFEDSDNTYSYNAVSYSGFDTYFQSNHGISLKEEIDKIKNKYNENIKLHNENVENLKYQIFKINNLTTNEFLSIYNCFNIENDFIKLCFEKGYIENDYLKFIFGENESFLPEQENSFVRYVEYGEINSPVQDNFQYSLSEECLSLIVKNISDERFLSYKILNFNLLNFILEKEEEIGKNKYENFNRLLNSNNENVYRFYKEIFQFGNIDLGLKILERYLEANKLIIALSDVFISLDSKKQDAFITYILSININESSDQTQINLVNLINNVSNLGNLEIENLIDNLLKFRNIFIKDISQFKNNQLNGVISNNLFEINNNNIMYFSKIYAENTYEENILNELLSNQELINTKKYLLCNIDKILQTLKNQKIECSLAEDILSSNDFDEEIKLIIIKNLKFTVSAINNISPVLFDELIKNDRLIYKLDTIFEIYKTTGFEKVKKYFLQDKYDKLDCTNLKLLKNESGYNDFSKQIQRCVYLTDYNIEAFDIFDLTIENLSTIQYSEENDLYLTRIVKNGKISTTTENFNALRNLPTAFIAFIEKDINFFINEVESGNILLTDELKIQISNKCKKRNILKQLKSKGIIE